MFLAYCEANPLEVYRELQTVTLGDRFGERRQIIDLGLQNVEIYNNENKMITLIV